MKQKIFLLFAMLVGFTMQAMATAIPDSVFVVKSGRIVSAYEVGKDVDNITFPKKIKIEGNIVKLGDESFEVKSAVFATVNNYNAIILSSLEGCETVEEAAVAGKYLQVALVPSLFGKDITFSTFETDFDSDNEFYQVMFMDVDKYEEDDDYEALLISSSDWEDYCKDGSLRVSVDNDQLFISLETTPQEGVEALFAQYEGGFAEVIPNEDHFTVDGERYELRAVFAEQKAEGINFYLTPGNIDSALELENCYYYVRLFVPQSNMDGRELDVQGRCQEYELTFVDNVTDVNNPQIVNISSDNPASAQGTISVLDNEDGTYDVRIDIRNLGTNADRTLSVVYVEGTPMEYSLVVPSNYTVANEAPIDLKSAILKYNETEKMYTIYLSSKENVTTLEGMADADIVVTMPEDFVNDDKVHGFSGDENNAKVSVKYAGDTFCQSTTSSSDDALALGGNAKLSFVSTNAVVDFTVFSIKKYQGALKGHYEGNVIRL